MALRKPDPRRNRLLAELSDRDHALLEPHLSAVTLVRNQVLIEPGEDILHCWFIETGIASVVAGTRRGDQSEVGLIGPEGMVDVAIVHNLHRSLLRCFVQAPGEALRIGAVAMQEALLLSTTLRNTMLAYSHGFLLQVSSNTLANASFTLEERIARWLLMYHDRTSGNELAVTHELVSLTLNVRRAGVTTALRSLNTAELIQSHRGRIIISDRTALEKFAGDGYGAAERISFPTE